MPEGYLHVRCARNAYRRSGAAGFDIAAVVAGANGPDPLFYHLGWPNLIRLGQRMHRERCGPFLTALVRYADGPVQRGFALGFLSHNATDSVFHPWVAALTGPNGPYRTPGGHALLESGLDCRYLEQDKGRDMVLPADGTARLGGEKAEELGLLLSRCLREVYGVALSPQVLGACQRHIYTARLRLLDPHGRKRRVLSLAERLLGRDLLGGHFQPGRPVASLPDTWTDPFTGAARREGPDELVGAAETLSERLMAAALRYWSGGSGPLELSREIGDRSYETGLPSLT